MTSRVLLFMLCQKEGSFISGPVHSVSQEEQDMGECCGWPDNGSQGFVFECVCYDAGGRSCLCACISFGIFRKLAGGLQWELNDDGCRRKINATSYVCPSSKPLTKRSWFANFRPFTNSLHCWKVALPGSPQKPLDLNAVNRRIHHKCMSPAQ